MKILITGKGGAAGSWKIRAQQMGAALGATVKPNATLEDCRSHDVLVAVKRVPEPLLQNIRASGKPWVYDVLDAYPQPEVSRWPRAAAVAWVRERMSYFQPSAVIWPNMHMMTDCSTGRTETVIRHHHWPDIARNPIRDQVKLVNYEGAPEYLGEWHHWLVQACRRRGWAFGINTPIYTAADIVVAFRGIDYAGYAQRNWKSNVKLANAHASGTPFIGQTESGYLESSNGFEYWAQHHSELDRVFDILADKGTRERISDRFVKSAYSVAHASRDLSQFLHGL